MENQLISIIIPLYNAEGYVDRIVPCVMKQTYPNLEILLVNDGSTDHTLEKCQAYQAADGRIRVLSQDNGGVGAARNYGLAEAQGDYVSFVDGDDYLKPDFIETLYRCAVREDCDVVCADYVETLGDYSLTPLHGVFPPPRAERTVESHAQVLRDYCKNVDQYGAIACAKLWARPLAQMERFDKLRYGEDTLYTQSTLRHAKRIKLLGYQGYYYIRWDLSATKRKPLNDYGRLTDYVTLKKEMVHICAEVQDETLLRTFREQYASAIVTVARATIEMPPAESREIQRKILQELKEERLFPLLPLPKRAELFLCRYCNPLYRAAMKRHLAAQS